MAPPKKIGVFNQRWMERIEAAVERVENNLDVTGRTIRRGPVGDVGGGCDTQNAIIDISVLGRPSSGSFTLLWTINGTPGTITHNWNANSSAFATSLAGHSVVSSTSNITVTGGPFPNVTMRVEFKGTLANADISLPVADWTNLLGGVGIAVVCAMAQKGHS